MNVCVKCRVEMRCTKNGVYCVFGESHTYPGDKFTCPKCGAEFVRCNQSAYEYPDVLTKETENCIVRMESK